MKFYIRKFTTGGRGLVSSKSSSGLLSYSPVTSASAHLFSLPFCRFLREVSGQFQVEFRSILKKREELRRAGMPKVLKLRGDLAWIRADLSWRAPTVVPELEKRWCEITGPAGDAKMVINALNSGADQYMCDLEDSSSPHWIRGVVQSHANLYNAVRGTLVYEHESKTKIYSINKEHAVLHVRPRGLHMWEEHVIDESGRPIPAALFDIAIFAFHNAEVLMSTGRRPIFYIPKIEQFEEAKLVHDVIQQCELALGIPYGTCRATVLIETLPAALQAEEIGFALGPYWAGLNAGRWDYLFSVLKERAMDPRCVLPDRHHLTMQTPFLTSMLRTVVKTCHARGVHAIGGMSAYIPERNVDAAHNEEILQKVVRDKAFEISEGCDGAWVAHPALVGPIRNEFRTKLHGMSNQIYSPINTTSVIDPSSLAASPWASDDINDDFGERVPSPAERALADICTAEGISSNISVAVQYVASYLSYVGAVALNGCMEDLATAEICRMQVWQWLHSQQKIKFGNDHHHLNSELYKQLHAETMKTLISECNNNTTISVAHQEQKLFKLNQAGDIIFNLIMSDTLKPFITDSAYHILNSDVPKPIPLRKQFVAVKFSKDEISALSGSHPHLVFCAQLAAARGQVYNSKVNEIRRDGLVGHGNFVGAPTGHAARNIIEGGLGETWAYIGGWELNARGLEIGQPMPDTLSVGFTEQGSLAKVINRYLTVADQVQHLESMEAAAKHQPSSSPSSIHHKNIDYLTQPMLADLEQGWGDPKKVFHSVIRCLQNGVNMMHIEDQYSLKRCGHLGGKGLEDINTWKITMRSANLAAALFSQIHRDGIKQNCNFVARTDALSAEFIQFSENMRDPTHLDHPYIDWTRGFTADGKYLYLRDGVNPDTGRKWGLEHSAVRCAEIVKDGLASHVWMETPDANVAEAQQFMDLVNNEHLAPHGVFARGLYNQSPSFLWDVSFFLESQEISAKVADFIHKLNGISPLLPVDQCKYLVKKFLAENGDRTRGDYRFSDEYVEQILGNGLDLARGKTSWHSQISKQMRLLESIGPSLQGFKGKAEAERILALGFRPLRHITNIIVAQRLKNFKDRISNAGFECLLTTLPLYPSDALTASKLARGMTETGIHDFVINQRAARKYADSTGNLTCFFHQKATGTGYEQKLNSILGNSNTSLLDGSTEAESRRQEQVLRNQGIKVGDGILTGEW